jgi:hypothetical protein
MRNKNGKWWLAVVIACCLAPAAFANPGRDHDELRYPERGCNPQSRARCQPAQPAVQVPEGGSAAVYLLGAGLTCIGAMFLRSRAAKPTQA